jgi:hypothetical protein
VDVKVAEVIVNGFMALLKVALTLELSDTPVAAFKGITELTLGATGAAVPPLLSPRQPAIDDNNRKTMSHLMGLVKVLNLFISFLL